MKYIILLFLAVVTLNANSQVSFPENHPELLKGKKVKIVEPEFFQDYGYQALFKTNKSPMKSFKNLPKAEQSRLLTGKEFIVEEIGPAKSYSSKSYDYMITLKADDGTVIYHRYNSINKYDYPLEIIGGLDLPENFYCELITKSTGADFFQNETPIGGVLIRKEPANEYRGIVYNVGYRGFLERDAILAQGFTLVFDNGKKIANRIKMPLVTYVGNGSYRYEDSVDLSEKEFEMLINNKLTGVILDGEFMPFDVKQSDKLKAIATCFKDIK